MRVNSAQYLLYTFIVYSWYIMSMWQKIKIEYLFLDKFLIIQLT